MFKTRTKRLTAAVLALLMITALLAGCGKKGKDEGKDLSEFVYVPNYATMPKEIKEMNNVTCQGDLIYFTSNLAVHSDGSLVTDAEIQERDKYYNSLGSADAPAAKSTTVTAEGAAIESSSAPVVDGGSIPEKDFDINYKTVICSVKTDGTEYKQLTGFEVIPKPEGEDVYSSLDKIITDSTGTLWVMESVTQTIYELPADFDPATQEKWKYYKGEERSYTLRKLSETGAEVARINLSDFLEKPADPGQGGSVYINYIILDKQGDLYIADGKGVIYVVGSDGAFKFKLTMDGYTNGLVILKDGSVGVIGGNKEGKTILAAIDMAAKAWGKQQELTANVWNTSSGGSVYDFCYNDSSSLFGYDLATGTSTKILTWLNCNVDGNNIQYTTVRDNGDVFAINNTWDENGNVYEVITLVKTPRADVKEKKVLTMATMWLDYNIRAEILKFNKSNTEYQIEISDYSEYNTQEDYNAGITKLNTEIISGKIPDIIQISNLPYKQYAAKGLLEDLYTFMDNDPDIKRENLVQSILKAIETDGKLYTLVPSFSVFSIVGSPDVLGAETGWTMAEMQQTIKDNPQADVPFGLHITKNDIFQGLCMLNMENYINWQTGQCSFDSAEFKGLLEFANGFPEKIENDDNEQYIGPEVLVPEGRQIMQMFNLYSLDSDFQYNKALFGGKLVFKGLPSENKDGNVAQVQGGLAMTSSCKYKEGAWQFMRTLLTDEYQSKIWELPISQKAFDAKLAEAMKQEYTTDENGNKVPVSHGGMSTNNGPVIEFYALSQEEADQLVGLIGSVKRTASFDQSQMNIINEEAQAYFSGAKSVDETASIIQSRMNIYVNEQK